MQHWKFYFEVMKKSVIVKSCICLLVSLFTTFSVLTGQVVINEYSAANLTTALDDFEQFEDWVELYNTADSKVDLSGYGLSDDLNRPLKWKIPTGVVMDGKSYLIIWCDNRDSVSFLKNERQLHSNFNLTQTRKNAQTIVLSNAAGKIIDQSEIKKTRKDQSRGRLQDGEPIWVIFSQPSPARENFGMYYTSNADKPRFSQSAGYYKNSFLLNISSKDPNLNIYYTTDGSEPDTGSTPYRIPIQIDKHTIVKAVCVSNDALVQNSLTEFATYFIAEKPRLKVISISGGLEMDSLLLGDRYKSPFGTFEYFNEDGIRKAVTYGEFNSHGRDSWINNQRSVDFISRDECGYNKAINEKIFSLSPRDEFQRVILRAAGDDNYPDGSLTQGGGAHLRDAFVQNLAKKGGLNLDVRTAEKAILYMNGKYWGIYDIREIPDDHDYTKHYYNQGKYDIEMLQTWGVTWAKYGDTLTISNWDSLAAFITTRDMADAKNYQYAESQIDFKSLCDYIIVNSITVCSDWLNYNTGWWRGKNPAGGHRKWGYQLWDNDASFGYYINYSGIKDTSAIKASPCDIQSLSDSVTISFGTVIAWDTLIIALTTFYPGDTISAAFSFTSFVDVNRHMSIFNALMRNEQFKQYYISRYHDLMKTVFSKENMLQELDAVVNSIAPEMPAHIRRWGGSMREWTGNVNRLRDYIFRRSDYLTAGLRDCYQLTGPYPVTFDTEGASSPLLDINSIAISKFPYTSSFFGNIGIVVSAKPNDAQSEFKRWTAPSQIPYKEENPGTATFYPKSAGEIKAVFGPKLVGISDSHNNDVPTEFIVYPTLFDNQIFVKCTSVIDNSISIRLLDINGRQVSVHHGKPLESTSDQGVFSIDLSDKQLSPGIYLLDIGTGSKHALKKVVKQ